MWLLGLFCYSMWLLGCSGQLLCGCSGVMVSYGVLGCSYVVTRVF